MGWKKAMRRIFRLQSEKDKSITPNLIPICENRIIFQRTLVRSPYGRIFTEEDHIALDEDDVRGFIQIAEKFDSADKQVVKVTYIINEHLNNRYNNRRKIFESKGIPTDEVLVFHGTSKSHIDDIITNGFKIGGIDGHPVVHGKAYGSGIYTDIDGETAKKYTSDACLIACRALPGQLSDPQQPVVKKQKIDSVAVNSVWYVLKNADQVLPCYVIYFERGHSYEPLLPVQHHFIHPHLDEEDVENETTVSNCVIEHHDRDAVDVFSSSLSIHLPPLATKAIQRQLLRVLKIQMNSHVKERGWILDASVMSALDVWKINMVHFDEDLPLANDLVKHGLEAIEMEFTFPEHFPNAPPFARVVRPRLLRFIDGGGGHVEAGGAICVELLTASGWDPSYHMDGIFQIIHVLLSTPYPAARLAKNWRTAYTMQEARDAFARVAAVHNWKI